MYRVLEGKKLFFAGRVVDRWEHGQAAVLSPVVTIWPGLPASQWLCFSSSRYHIMLSRKSHFTIFISTYILLPWCLNSQAFRTPDFLYLLSIFKRNNIDISEHYTGAWFKSSRLFSSALLSDCFWVGPLYLHSALKFCLSPSHTRRSKGNCIPDT